MLVADDSDLTPSFGVCVRNMNRIIWFRSSVVVTSPPLYIAELCVTARTPNNSQVQWASRNRDRTISQLWTCFSILFRPKHAAGDDACTPQVSETDTKNNRGSATIESWRGALIQVLLALFVLCRSVRVSDFHSGLGFMDRKSRGAFVFVCAPKRDVSRSIGRVRRKKETYGACNFSCWILNGLKIIVSRDMKTNWDTIDYFYFAAIINEHKFDSSGCWYKIWAINSIFIS